MDPKEIKLKGLNPEQTANLLPEGLISLCWRGSIAHGMYVPDSNPDSIDDKDVIGIYVNPIEHYLGFGREEVFEKWEGQYDCVFYEVRKMFNLLLQCNPNVLSILWLKPNGIIWEHSLGQRLRDSRKLFVTKKAYHSFTGYAYNQLKRMSHFNQAAQQMMTSLEDQLRRVDIDPDSADEGDSLRHLNGEPYVGASHEIMELVRRYRGERNRYFSGGYMGKKRRELVRRSGYDTKNAAHLIRLLRMSIEFLTEGSLYVERSDKAELMDIKLGQWPFEKVNAEAERLFKLAEEAYVRSLLPAEPDRESAEKLCVSIVQDYHNSRNLDH